MFNGISSSVMNNFTTVQELTRTPENIQEQQFFFKDQGQN